MRFPRNIIVLILALMLAGCGGLDFSRGYGGRAPSTHVPGVAHGSAYEGYLTHSDTAYMSDAFSFAMAADEGTAQDWRNSRSGARGTITAHEAYLLDVDYARGRRLTAPIGLYTDYPLEPAQGDYEISSNTNVRLGASTSAPIVTTLSAGSVVEAAGQVRGGEWMLVARGGAVIGYMYAEFLEQRAGGDVLLAGGAPRRPTYCRSYEQRLTLRGGERDHWRGAACRARRGEWNIEGWRGAGS